MQCKENSAQISIQIKLGFERQFLKQKFVIEINKSLIYLFTDGSNDLLSSWIELGEADIFQAVLEQMKKVPNMDVLAILAERCDQSEKGNTVLHVLSQGPEIETRIDLIMDLIKFGLKPGLKNVDQKTFLDGSDIKKHLLEKIRTSSDEWASGLINAWTRNIGGE